MAPTYIPLFSLSFFWIISYRQHYPRYQKVYNWFFFCKLNSYSEHLKSHSYNIAVKDNLVWKGNRTWSPAHLQTPFSSLYTGWEFTQWLKLPFTYWSPAMVHMKAPTLCGLWKVIVKTHFQNFFDGLEEGVDSHQLLLQHTQVLQCGRQHTHSNMCHRRTWQSWRLSSEEFQKNTLRSNSKWDTKIYFKYI